MMVTSSVDGPADDDVGNELMLVVLLLMTNELMLMVMLKMISVKR